MTDFDPNSPIYLQIMRTIKQRIVSGALKAGERLPSVREQAETFAVNPNTVQRAYQELEREGITETKRGMGTFIAEKETLITDIRTEMAGEILRDFIRGMRVLGHDDASIVATLKNTLGGTN